jgi:diguanylate cyclase (GGDEF)-like protein/PAS domain S-box-containing protein
MAVIWTPSEVPCVLIVDDEEFMRIYFTDVLERGGYLVVTAQDGDAALHIIRERKPDLVILDLVMPGKDGFTTCREIRELSRDLPVLVVTGLEDTKSVHLAFEAGATDFVTKPVKAELLAYRVHYLFKASNSRKKLVESEARLAYAQEIASLGNWEWSLERGFFTCSHQALRILNHRDDADILSLESFLSTVCPFDREPVKRRLEAMSEQTAELCIEFQVIRSDGARRTVKMIGRSKENRGDFNMQGIVQDITDLRQVESNLIMLRTAVDSLPIGITLTGLDGRIIYSNPAEAEMHGYKVEDLVGQAAWQFAPPELRKPLHSVDYNEIVFWKRETSNIKNTGEKFPVQLTSTPVKGASGRCLGMVTACEDITARKTTEETINKLAYYDILTGLPNRLMFLDRLRHALAMANRNGHSVGLLFVDLDNFKDVNDTIGHDIGDKLLQEVAKRLALGVRGADTLARLGGDEFVVILISENVQEGTTLAAERILDLFHAPLVVNGDDIYCSASIGGAFYPENSGDFDGLIKCADTAMYHAKGKGKGLYCIYSPEMERKVMRRVSLENSLRHALERNEFTLLYQPKWELATRKMVGVEALLRWRCAKLGYVTPSEFVAIAEQNGSIVRIGEWALSAACTQAKYWLEEGYGDLRVAVNISGRQLKQRNFFEKVKQTILTSGIPPEMLELEITENVLMEPHEYIIKSLDSIKRLGVSLSIDDFGTGYSCINNLRHFSIDKLKIDHTFIANITKNKGDAAIVSAIISMAHSLDLKVVAEGVEDKTQLKLLKAMACDEVQGFFLGKPMAAEDVPLFLGTVDSPPQKKSILRAPALDNVLAAPSAQHFRD